MNIFDLDLNGIFFHGLAAPTDAAGNADVLVTLRGLPVRAAA